MEESVQTRCPVCKSERTHFVAQKNQCVIWQCDECRMVFKPHVPAKYEEVQEGIYQDARSRNMVRKSYRMAQDRLDFVKRYKTAGTLLEIGCATGEFLELAKKQGFEELGIEGSRAYAEFARSKGLNVVNAHLEDGHAQGRTFDVVAMFHVFEHIMNPVEFLGLIKKYLKEDGLLFIVVPNLDSFVTRFLGFWHPNFQQEDHLLFFNKASLEDAARRAGFEPVLAFSKEYPHSVFYALRGGIVTFLREGPHRKRPAASAGGVPVKRMSTAKRILMPFKPALELIYKHGPYYLGYILYPFMKLYAYLLEGRYRGHELYCLLRPINK